MLGDAPDGSCPAEAYQYIRARCSKAGGAFPRNEWLDVEGVDQRSTWVRRARDVVAAHLSDLGGSETFSTAEQKHRAARCNVNSRVGKVGERVCARRGGDAHRSGNLEHAASPTGSDWHRRRPRNITPTLSEHLDLLASLGVRLNSMIESNEFDD
jgi:hypothetical protein